MTLRATPFLATLLVLAGCDRPTEPEAPASVPPPSLSTVTDITITDLGTLGGTLSVAVAINALGQIAGWSTTASEELHPVLWDSGTMTDLGTLGGTLKLRKRVPALALNDLGQVVGVSTAASGETRAFFWDKETIIDLGTLGGTGSLAVAINSLGQVAGFSTTTSGERHATLWTIELRPATAEEEIVILQDAVDQLVGDGTLSSGQAAAVHATLDTATRLLNDGKDESAARLLQAFLRQVEAYMAAGILSHEDGQSLIDAAQNAIDQLTA